MEMKINLAEKFSKINDHWKPRVVGKLNGQHLRLVKFIGEFVWHQHCDEDELFLVIKGSFTMQFRDHVETILENEFIIVPAGVEHCPKADTEVEVLLFEPANTINTGEINDDLTVHILENI